MGTGPITELPTYNYIHLNALYSTQSLLHAARAHVVTLPLLKRLCIQFNRLVITDVTTAEDLFVGAKTFAPRIPLNCKTFQTSYSFGSFLEEAILTANAYYDSQALHKPEIDTPRSPTSFTPPLVCFLGPCTPLPQTAVPVNPVGFGIDADRLVHSPRSASGYSSPEIPLSQAVFEPNLSKKRKAHHGTCQFSKKQKRKRYAVADAADSAAKAVGGTGLETKKGGGLKGYTSSHTRSSSPASKDGRPLLPEQLDKLGFYRYEWDTFLTHLVLNDEERVIMVLVGNPSEDNRCPPEQCWCILLQRLAKKMEAESFSQKPQALHLSMAHHCLAECLKNNKDLQRVAGFQSGTFTPAWDPSFTALFLNSVYTAGAMNFGPETCCDTHFDVRTYPGLPCAVTAFSDFNPNRAAIWFYTILKYISTSLQELPSFFLWQEFAMGML
ncbi:hypothetical protein K488DRAFT_73967 [Vararia minispora EC-137]|uniref:Uncharacterized protein n=1 Tax=Vararia minispora EC-137 TaxID=1314806 RepID=A0ACB8Q9G6_9AGAM|nr:hypothetical protein K488DRAFT_73967 [Vararia minispora EC-137]